MRSYRRAILLAYVINTLTALSFSLSFKFGLFLEELQVSPFIIGCVIAAAVLFGVGIKVIIPKLALRYDYRILWATANAAMLLGAILLQQTDHFGLDIFLGRSLFVIGFAGATVLAISFVQACVPKVKATGAITLFGGSLFIGMLSAAVISDQLQAGMPAMDFHDLLFLGSAISAFFATLLCAFIPASVLPKQLKKRFADWQSYVRACRHWTGWGAILLGGAFAIPQLFLAMYALSIDIATIASFFYGYTITAFALRVLTYRLVDRVPRALLVSAGFGCLALAMLAYMQVKAPIDLVIPGILTAFCRTLAEPSLLTLGGERVSKSSQITGTATISALIDIGLITLAPVLGAMISWFGFTGFFIAFIGASLTITAVALVSYLRKISARNSVDIQPDGDFRKMLVTEAFHPSFVSYLSQMEGIQLKYLPHCSRVDLLHEIQDTHILICRVATQVDKKVIEAGQHLELIASGTTGLNHIDLESAFIRDIPVYNCDYDTSASVAELSLTLIFCALRGVHQADQSMKAGFWERETFQGQLIKTKRIGVWGAGCIGLELAKSLKQLGCEVTIFDPSQIALTSQMGFRHAETFDKFLSETDILCIQVPLTATTYQAIHEKSIASMPPGAIIINTSRGEIINEPDLIHALDNHHLAYYGSDVWINEPHYNRTLAAHPRVVATPHLGAMTDTAQKDVARALIARIQDRYNHRLGARDKMVLAAPFTLECFNANTQKIEIRATDFSDQGLGFISDLPVEIGQDVRLALWDRKIDGQISWVEMQPAGGIAGGISLSEPFAPEELTLLEQAKDRREVARQPALQVLAKIEGFEHEFVLLKNQSERGALIESSAQLSTGSQIQMMIAGHGIQYEVRWKQVGQSPYRTTYGLELIEAIQAAS